VGTSDTRFDENVSIVDVPSPRFICRIGLSGGASSGTGTLAGTPCPRGGELLKWAVSTISTFPLRTGVTL
jgi:hypothetical protein